MKRIGLTGGIASGKSAVAKMLRDVGIAVVDADVLAREVVQPGTPGLALVEAAFPGVVQDGVLDRQALGKIVFSDGEARAKLNALLHPFIVALAEDRMSEVIARGEDVVFEAALLFEMNLDDMFDEIILVVVPDIDEQRRRLMQRNNLSREEADARIQAQLSVDRKRRRATLVLDNSGSLEVTERSLRLGWASLMGYELPGGGTT